MRRPFFWLIALVTVLLAVVPYVTDDVQLRESLLLACVYIILASNLNLMIGYAGYVNFGNIVFFGLGGYISIYLVDTLHAHIVIAVLVAGIGVSARRALVRPRHSAFARGLLRIGDNRSERGDQAAGR